MNREEAIQEIAEAADILAKTDAKKGDRVRAALDVLVSTMTTFRQYGEGGTQIQTLSGTLNITL